MDQREKVLARVRESAESLRSLVAPGRSNVPLESYLPTTDVNALTDSLGMAPDEWSTEDLERILIIRDGLYDVRQRLRDVGDEAEHSIDHVLTGMDRLYADLERALREIGQQQLQIARGNLTKFGSGPAIDTASVRPATDVLISQATEVLTYSHQSVNKFEFSLIKIDGDVNVSLLKNAKLNVKRLSASVFALKLSLQQSTIFEGTFKFLNENADKIVAELKKFVDSIKGAYGSVRDLLADVTKLAEAGGRFTRQVSSFIESVFSASEPMELSAKLQVQISHSSNALTCGTEVGGNLLAFGGRGGAYLVVDSSTGRLVDQKVLKDSTIFSMTSLGEGRIGIGNDSGFSVLKAIGRDTSVLRSNYRERVVAIAPTLWGGRGEAIVTGASDGYIRRWTYASGLSRYATGIPERYVAEKIGRGLKKIVSFDDKVVAAYGDTLFYLDEELSVTTRVPGHFIIEDFAILPSGAIIACGEGNVANINTESGYYTRFIASGSNETYSCIVSIDERVIATGTESGKVILMDLDSGAEIGHVSAGMPIRGMIVARKKIFAFGGVWGDRGEAIAIISYELNKSPVLASS